MARTITFEGRTVSVPDDATEAEIASILNVPLVQPASERSALQELGRQGGLTIRAGLEGVASIPQILGGALEAAGIKGAGVNVGRQVSDILGLPSPQTGIERVSGSVASAMAGGMPFIKAGRVISEASALPEVARDIGRVMAAQPTAQTALAGVSGGASKMAEEGGLGPGAQLAAGIVAPAVALPIASSALATGRTIKSIATPLTGDAALEKGAARLAVRALGKRAEQGATALGAASDDVTAGQVAAAIDNADLAALQKLANQRDASFADLIQRGTQAKIKQAWNSLEEALAPVREEALSLAEKGGVDATQIANKIAFAKNARGDKTNPVVQKSMSDIEDMLKVAVNPETGLADPVELNNIRKQIRNLIEKHSKESNQWDAKRTSGLERQVQLAIDDAIDSGIAKADPSKAGLWSLQYMEPYRAGANKIRATEKGLEREIELATKGLPEVSKVIGDTENPTRGLNLLSRIATITNFAIRAAENSAGKAVEKKLAQMMASSEMGGDKQRLSKLMMTEINKPKSMLESMVSKRGMTRAELGYGMPEKEQSTQSQGTRRIAINQDIPIPEGQLLVIHNAPPLVPGSWKQPVQPSTPNAPLPVLPDQLKPLSEQYATSTPIGAVEGGMLSQNTPLPTIPKQPSGMLSLAEPQLPIPDTKRLATRHDVPTMEFPLRQEVLQKFEPQITAFRSEAQRLKDIINNKYPIDGKKQAAAQVELNKLEQEFLAGMRMLGIENSQEAIGILRKIYEGGKGTKLPVEKTQSFRGK